LFSAQIIWKTGIHQKGVYTNGFAALEGPRTGAGVYILAPMMTKQELPELSPCIKKLIWGPNSWLGLVVGATPKTYLEK
jgi:hypothetical protein